MKTLSVIEMLPHNFSLINKKTFLLSSKGTDLAIFFSKGNVNEKNINEILKSKKIKTEIRSISGIEESKIFDEILSNLNNISIRIIDALGREFGVIELRNIEMNIETKIDVLSGTYTILEINFKDHFWLKPLEDN
jgi:hypothetical protein